MNEQKSERAAGTAAPACSASPLQHKWVKDDRYGLPICAYCGHVLRRDHGNRDDECPGRVRVALRGLCSVCGRPRLECRCHFGTVVMPNARPHAPERSDGSVQADVGQEVSDAD
jgi:Zn ribbon nucleic-acid-binding protein